VSSLALLFNTIFALPARTIGKEREIKEMKK
jgi:hypothetical protein